ncbi:MAG: SRPBCC family protein, partial [Sphingomonadaceae bacterium]|nr:SRPBCC family protein [Sphingomonadaceae bacterium]
WNALVDGDLTKQYWGHENRSDWKPGSRWEHVRVGPEGKVDVAGRVLEIEPPRRLVTSWAFPGEEDDPARTSRVTYEIEPVGSESRLTVTHSDLNEPRMRAGVSAGWPLVLSSLKSFLERGTALEALNARIKELEED